MKQSYYIKLIILIAVLCVRVNVHAQTDTFIYTGGIQTWTVPSCVTSILVDVQGAIGGHSGSRGGYGGRVSCTLTVTPGTIMIINVGGSGVMGSVSAGAGGFNGGGDGQYSGLMTIGGGGGGGASDIRVPPYTLSDRLVVAAGGGGGGWYCGGTNENRGGDGGGIAGEHGYNCNVQSDTAGAGGTSSFGGIGGVYPGRIDGETGLLGMGGTAGIDGAGGGGGGGLWGGGGGCPGGGGGGSSYANPVVATGIVDVSGYNTLGNGMVIITIPCTPPGSITGATSVCVGVTTQLSDAVAMTCVSGTWSSSNSAVAAVSPTGIVAGISPGTALITYNIANPCGGASATQAVTVNSLPAAIGGTADAICVGATATLSDATASGTWSSSATGIATIDASTGVITGVAPGTANMTYRLVTGCNVNAVAGIFSCPTDVSQTIAPDKYKVIVFPNPANNELTIKTEGGKFKTLTIYNCIGQVFLQQQLTATQTTVNVKMLPAAFYYISLRGDFGSVVGKFVKE